MVDWEGEGLEVMVRNNVGWVSGGGGGRVGMGPGQRWVGCCCWLFGMW